MKTTSRILLLLSGLVIVLSGCAGLTGGAGSSALTAALSSDQTLAVRTGLGILNLEGQALAVDAEQAAAMLPLWQALLTLSSDSNTSPDEITALNEQIQESLSADQLAAIAGMNWDEAELSEKVSEYISSDGQISGKESPAAAAASAPREAGGSGMPVGAPPDGGGDMMNLNTSAANTVKTSQSILPEQSDREAAGGLNLILAPAVIQLLQSKLALA